MKAIIPVTTASRLKTVELSNSIYLWEYNQRGVLGKYIASKYFIPKCCFECKHFDYGEYEDGYRLSSPFCYKNVWFPTTKGTCKKQNA